MPNENTIRIDVERGVISGTWFSVRDPVGVVLFALPSSTGRMSLRDRHVADACCQQGFSVLVLDLLTLAEDRRAPYHSSVELLRDRLRAGLKWISDQTSLACLPIGVFAANAVAAAAFVFAAETQNCIQAIVTRNGRPDFATSVLSLVKCPTLLIIAGGEHPRVAEANQKAYQSLRCPKKFFVVPPASSRLFKEPDAIQQLAVLTADWFARYVRHDETLAVLKLLDVRR